MQTRFNGTPTDTTFWSRTSDEADDDLFCPSDTCDALEVEHEDCGGCGGSGEKHSNPSPINDPQAVIDFPCDECHGDGAFVVEVRRVAWNSGMVPATRVDPSYARYDSCPECGAPGEAL